VCAKKNIRKIYERKNWRLNNTLRQRLSKLGRKAQSFSKQEYMLNLHGKMFAVHYNLECINYRFQEKDYLAVVRPRGHGFATSLVTR
jgi:hypothetical protein